MLIHTEVDIDAAPAQVWSVLTDLDSYQHWNPFIVRAGGDLRPGGTLVNVMRFGKSESTFTPTVVKVEPERELRWRGRHRIPGVFSGEHFFGLTDLAGGRTRLVQAERFRGIALVLLARILREDTPPRFEEMNQALKERAEALAAQSGR